MSDTSRPQRLRESDSLTFEQDADRLCAALSDLLETTELNLDGREPETEQAIDRAREVLDGLRHGLKKFRVRFARVVIMETDVLAETEHDIASRPLPGVYEGIPAEHVPVHVEDIVEYDAIWEIRESD